MKTELKPCPFCGGKALLVTKRAEDSTFYGVMCYATGCCVISATYPTEEMAIEAWNRRTEVTDE